MQRWNRSEVSIRRIELFFWSLDFDVINFAWSHFLNENCATDFPSILLRMRWTITLDCSTLQWLAAETPVEILLRLLMSLSKGDDFSKNSTIFCKSSFFRFTWDFVISWCCCEYSNRTPANDYNKVYWSLRKLGETPTTPHVEYLFGSSSYEFHLFIHGDLIKPN